MPVPTSVLVVKKGSKMRERFSGVMPWPLSAMEMVALPLEQAASMRIRPPDSGNASQALETRLVRIWRRSSAGMGRLKSRKGVTQISAPREAQRGWNMPATESMVSATLTGPGAERERTKVRVRRAMALRRATSWSARWR